LLVFDEVDLEAVLHSEGFGSGKAESNGGAGCRCSLTPVLLIFEGGGVGLGELDVGVGVGGATGNVVDDFFAGNAVDDCGLILVEVFGGDFFEAGLTGGLEAGEIFTEIGGVASVLVVAVECVGYAAEATEALEAGDLLREIDSAGGVELFFCGTVGLKLGELLPEGGFEVFELDVGLGGDGALHDGGELKGVVRASDRLRDLLFVDENLIEPAGLGAAEDVGEEVGIGVAGSICGGCEEGDAELWEFDRVGNGGAFLLGDGSGGDGDGVDLGALRDWAEVFGQEGLEFGGVEVAGDGERGVVRRVELLEEVADIVEACGFDVGVGADDVRVVRMGFGEEEMVDLFVGEFVRSAFTLATLVADDVALVGEFFAVEAFEEEAHAVAFKPEGELKLVAGDGFEVVGAVEVGGAVDIGCACALDVFDVGFFADVLGAFEHHVLEEVGEASASCALVERTDVVPEIDSDEGQAVVFVHEDDETVGHDEFFVLEFRDFERLRWWESIGGAGEGCNGESEQERGGGHAFCCEQRCFHLFSTEAGETFEECLVLG